MDIVILCHQVHSLVIQLMQLFCKHGKWLFTDPQFGALSAPSDLAEEHTVMSDNFITNAEIQSYEVIGGVAIIVLYALMLVTLVTLFRLDRRITRMTKSQQLQQKHNNLTINGKTMGGHLQPSMGILWLSHLEKSVPSIFTPTSKFMIIIYSCINCKRVYDRIIPINVQLYCKRVYRAISPFVDGAIYPFADNHFSPIIPFNNWISTR